MKGKPGRFLGIVALVLVLLAVGGCGQAATPAPEAPAATEAPAAAPTEAPAAATEAPMATEAPAETEAPMATEAPAMSGETEWSGPLVVGSCCDEPNTLDPAIAIDIPGTQLITGAYEGLTAYNPETGEIEPLLAESWE